MAAAEVTMVHGRDECQLIAYCCQYIFNTLLDAAEMASNDMQRATVTIH